MDDQIEKDALVKICETFYSPTAITFRKPQIAGWCAVFKDEHIAALESSAGALMQQYGYMD